MQNLAGDFVLVYFFSLWHRLMISWLAESCLVTASLIRPLSMGQLLLGSLPTARQLNLQSICLEIRLRFQPAHGDKICIDGFMSYFVKLHMLNTELRYGATKAPRPLATAGRWVRPFAAKSMEVCAFKCWGQIWYASASLLALALAMETSSCTVKHVAKKKKKKKVQQMAANGVWFAWRMLTAFT